ncbi:maltoporin [Vibrio rotiferianus]|uniref:Maltoporin n=1 Tax=Vibrio rotiferianus TaxID=190895 RepID=A0A510ICX4_9VIBR|nr:carbohydrate porin [Vibrio rotiferianus]BBL91583.1 maltoporin [Vibrio rotiferianus]
MKKVSAIAAAVVSTLIAGSTFAAEADFHGYFRAGFGANADGGSQYCYANGGPTTFGHSVGRLGDECDNYAEIALNVNKVWEGQDGSSFNLHTLAAYGTYENGGLDGRGNSFQSSGTDPDSPWSGERASFREAWVDYTMANGMRLWGGERYYGRKDIHIMDFYYLNNSGAGIGVENIDLGFGQLHAAVVQHKWKNPLTAPDADGVATPLEGTQVYSTANSIDLRLTGIETNDKGSLEVILLAAKPSHTDVQKNAIDNNVGNSGDYGLDKAGFFFTAEHTQGHSMGFNKAAIQYSTEGYAWAGFVGNHTGDSYNMELGQEGRKSFRLIDWGVVEAEKWNLGYSVVYAQLDKGTDGEDAKAMSVVVRPGYKWSETMSTIVEAGHFRQDFGADWGEGEWTDLTKFTVAQQWQAGDNFWARPAIRVFASKYTGDMALDNNELMFGAQVEAWW